MPPAFCVSTSRHGRQTLPRAFPQPFTHQLLPSFLFVPARSARVAATMRLVSAPTSLRPALATLPQPHSSCYGTIAADYHKNNLTLPSFLHQQT